MKNKSHYQNKTKQRESAQHRGYDQEWARVSKKYIKAFPTCARCGNKADMVDHIKPIKTHPHLRLVVSNWQSLCNRCHAIKTKRKDYGHSSGIMPDTDNNGMPLDPDHPWNK